MQVVSISSLKGGVGKTSVTLGLASAALDAGLRTLVVDLDPHADASTGLGINPAGREPIGLMLKNVRRSSINANAVPSSWTERHQEIVRSVQASQSDSKDDAAASDSEEAAAGESKTAGLAEGRLDVAYGSAFTGIYDRPDLRLRDLKRLKTVLSRVTGYDLVLIDCPPSLNGLTRMAWYASDKVLLVAETSLFSVAGTERTMRALNMFRREFAPSIQTAGVVANKYRPESGEHQFRLQEMSTMFGDALLSPVLPDIPDWQQIQGAAHAVHQWPTESARLSAVLLSELLEAVRNK
ncbi:ParA family protein [Neomicrococcus lactis]|uniref:Cellulose biosynthesis protein BcsQ n=1 Tax=Neomicrococcus lactis TaxID=732241 RepID=A0A7W8YAE6_9MICC|nr:cellulose biosynthesis protein BcsQ [Neomicrococcus lactis]